MSQTHTGRHRSAGYSAMNELGAIAARTARPAVKASALAVASGSLVASFAVPASAAPVVAASVGGAPAAAPAAPVPAAAPLAVAPAVAPLVSAQAVSAAAVVAPKTRGDVATAVSQGVLGFTAKKATAAATIKVQRLQAAATTTRSASRSAVRTSIGSGSTSSAPQNTAPVPAPTGGIIGIAASLTGIPYVYGGTSRSGFDCSGYTQYVYRLAGISIPRTAEGQRSASVKVSNPVPGDLIFFGFPAYHAGIYAGGGKLYHASRPGTVTSLASIWTYSNVSYGRF